MGFLLSTGDDPELSNSEDKRARKSNGSAETEVMTSASIKAEPGERVQTHADGLIGTVAILPEWLGDFELRQGPEAMLLGFRLKEGRKSQKVVAQGMLAEALATLKDDVVDKRVTCWGTLVGEEFTPKGTTRSVSYQILHLERIRTPDWELPAKENPAGGTAGAVPEVYPIAPGQETLALTDDEKKLIAGDLG